MSRDFYTITHKVPKMSPEFNKAQSLGRVRIETCSEAIWHSALKRGVVVAPLFSPKFVIQNHKNQNKKTSYKLI
jgi:hypothetical protein